MRRYFVLLLLSLLLGSTAMADEGLKRQSTRGFMPPQRTASLPGMRSKPKPVTASADVIRAAGKTDFIGSLIYAFTLNYGDEGLYRFTNPWSDNNPVEITNLLQATGGGCLIGDLYYSTLVESVGAGDFVSFLTIYDVATGQIVRTYEGDITLFASDYAYDPVTKLIYGNFADGIESRRFGYMDPETFEVTHVGLLPMGYWFGFACNSKGDLYGIDEAGDLYLMDKTRGGATFIGSTGMQPGYQSSLAFDPEDDTRLWWSMTETDYSYLCQINLQTGRASVVMQFPDAEEYVGIAVMPPAAKDNAPAEVTNVTATPHGLSTQMTFSATMPKLTFGGSQLTGQSLTLHVTVDDTEQLSRPTNPGTVETFTVNASTTGEHVFNIYASNAEGKGPNHKLRQWVGQDTPSAPQNVNIAYDPATSLFTIRWDAVTTGVHGGYVDPQAMTYDVIRYPGEAVVAENIAATETTNQVYDIGTIASYNYGVRARTAGLTSEMTMSNRVQLGAESLPWRETFSTPSALDRMTVIDANSDGHTWHYYNGNLRIDGDYDTKLNDWLIAPRMKLEAGRYYELSLDLYCVTNAETEKFSLWVGSDCTPQGMTTCLMPTTIVANSVDQRYAAGFVAPTEGYYYFGIKAESDIHSPYIYLDNMAVTAGKSPSIAARVTDLTVTPATMGHKRATLRMKAPATTVGGAALSAISKITIQRDSRDFKTLTDVTPGQDIEVDDTELYNGWHHWTIRAHTSSGEGEPADIYAFVGAYEPEPLAWLKASRTENDGEVRLSWPAEVNDIYGNPLSNEVLWFVIKYMNSRGEAVDAVRDARGTEFFHQLYDPEAPQQYTSYAIYATSEDGQATYTQSNIITAGKPLELPWVEPVANGQLHDSWAPESNHYNDYWSVEPDWDALPAQNSDGSMLLMYGRPAVGKADLLSPIISLTGDKPALEFYYFVPEGEWTNSIEVLVEAVDEFESVEEFKSGTPGWNRATVDLTPFAGKKIRFMLRGFTRSHEQMAVDNLRIFNYHETNLTVTDIQAPAQVNPDDEVTVTALITNAGLRPLKADQWYASLWRNDREVFRLQPGDLAVGQQLRFSRTEVVTPAFGEEIQYTVTVSCTGDEVADDNTAGPATVHLRLPDFMVPESLAAESASTGVTLTWQMPPEVEPEPVTDTFEQYESWAQTYVGDWTIRDMDGVQAGSIDLHPMPGVGDAPMAWTVFDYDTPDLKPYSTWTMRSGTKGMMAIFNYYSTYANDDWLISPRLSGDAQRVSIWARSVSNIYPESFEVLYSMDGTETTDFTLLSSHERIDGKWTEYVADIPAGARYFAIRCISHDCYMLFIDDVTFVPDTRSMQDLEGWNVYRDGIRVNDTLITGAMSWTDPLVDEYRHIYNVTAVYSKGESRGSEPAVVNPDGPEPLPEYSGLDSTLGSAVAVRPLKGEIVVTGAEGMPLTVVRPDGLPAANITACSHEQHIPLAPGVYIVKTTGLTAKVLVM